MVPVDGSWPWAPKDSNGWQAVHWLTLDGMRTTISLPLSSFLGCFSLINQIIILQCMYFWFQLQNNCCSISPLAIGPLFRQLWYRKWETLVQMTEKWYQEFTWCFSKYNYFSWMSFRFKYHFELTGGQGGRFCQRLFGQNNLITQKKHSSTLSWKKTKKKPKKT